MKRDYGNVGTIVLRASALLQAMSQDIEEQKKEFNLTEYHQTYTQNAVAKLPKLSRRIVELMGIAGIGSHVVSLLPALHTSLFFVPGSENYQLRIFFSPHTTPPPVSTTCSAEFSC